ncbi:unnamed protein product [Ilex paraguariensis]|uniref:RING-type E3 ubiquitin transferase n=1 Tax=Ilex paraguariensis TaxID=185542 RepID=A0ABC8SV46_9AQUA
MGSEGEIESEWLCDVDDTIFVAVGKNVKESKSILLWVAKSFSGRKLCLLHIHQPDHLITLVSEKLSAGKLKQWAVKACQELEQQKVHKLLNQYLLILARLGVQAGKVWFEMDNVEKGVVQIIGRHGIRWLVMGAAAEKHYSKNMSELKSNKAMFVCQHAPASCQIWFSCNGCLICTRSVNVGSDVGSVMPVSFPTDNRETTSIQNHAADADEDAYTFQCLERSTSLTDSVVCTFKSTPMLMDDIRGDGSPLASPRKSCSILSQSSSIILMDKKSQGEATCGMDDRLEHAMLDAEQLKQKPFEESVRRWKAEEDAMEAVRKAEASENSCMNEIKQRKELEEMLATQRQELERMKNQHNQCMKELHLVREQKPELQRQFTESRRAEEELEEKIIQAVELLITFKEKRDKLRTEHDSAIKELNRMRTLMKNDAMSLCWPQVFAFTFLEIMEATQNFDPSCKIGEGRHGSVYKGILRNRKLAIKMLPSLGSQGNLEFENEAGVLSRVRHPNLVTLIGTCPESRSLIYEYLENGNLEDRLALRERTPPLPWQTRIKIAIEICSALIFLHSNNPAILHGNLKPTQVLFDANFVSKVSGLGIHSLIPHAENTIKATTLVLEVDPEVSVYMDPEFLETGELTAESDVYSYGIILLRLLTGRPATGVVRDVKCAVESGNLSTVLDFSAGDWPLEQAQQLAFLGLGCCEERPLYRPDLVSDIWTVIELMRDLCTMLSHSSPVSKAHRRRIPSHFVCPILQEVMDDPYIASDGFTYEADAIRGWLNSGHKTSPMTNLELDHCDLLPNYALYNAIQEWRQQF